MNILRSEEEALKLYSENERLIGYAEYHLGAWRYPDTILDDLKQALAMGLWKACLCFDETKGYALSTFAYPIMQRSFYEALEGNTLIRLPRHKHEELRARLRHFYETGDEDELESISRDFSTSEYVFSIDTPKCNTAENINKCDPNAESSNSLYEVLADPNSDFVGDVCRQQMILDLLDSLDAFAKERKGDHRREETLKLVLKYYGLDTGVQMQYSELADILHTSRENVHQKITGFINSYRRSRYFKNFKKKWGEHIDN